jgi:hypothetical protein
MLAALCENVEFFRNKMNCCILLAPVATVHHAGAKNLHKLKEKESFVSGMRKMGPELFPRPQGANYVTSGFLNLSGMGNLSITEGADSNLDHLNRSAIPTFMGHFPSGTSFRCANHYR